MSVQAVKPIAGNREKINATFLARVDAWNTACGNKFRIDVGYRTEAKQAELYRQKLAGLIKHPVAKPGRSWHGGRGTGQAYAIDLTPWTNAADRARAAQYGLYFPMREEPWHVQPIEIKTGGLPGGGAAPATPGATVETTPTAVGTPDIMGSLQAGIADIIKFIVGVVLIGIALFNMTAVPQLINTTTKTIKSVRKVTNV